MVEWHLNYQFHKATFSILNKLADHKAKLISDEIIEKGFTITSASKSFRFSVWFEVVDFTATFTFGFKAFAISVIFKFKSSFSKSETMVLQFLF